MSDMRVVGAFRPTVRHDIVSDPDAIASEASPPAFTTRVRATKDTLMPTGVGENGTTSADGPRRHLCGSAGGYRVVGRECMNGW